MDNCPTCEDGEQNGDETGVDCGGSCIACHAPPNCDDGEQNGNETGVDCGGDCGSCDPGPLAGNGEPCDAGTRCASGHCPPQDGVCCDVACEGVCQSCRSAQTNFADGICAPIPVYEDPDGECPAQDASTCGATGQGCNGLPGAPACLFYDSSQVCEDSSCKDGVETSAARCTGQGACGVAEQVDCGEFTCSDDGSVCLERCERDEHCSGPSRRCDDRGRCVSAFSEAAEVLWKRDFTYGGITSAEGVVVDRSGQTIFHMACFDGWGLNDYEVGCTSALYHEFRRYYLDPNGVELTGGGPNLAPSPQYDQGQADISTAFARSGAASINGWMTDFVTDVSASRFTVDKADGTRAWQRSRGARWHTIDDSGAVVALFQDGIVDPGEEPVADGPALVRFNPAGTIVWGMSWPSDVRMHSDPYGALSLVASAADAEELGCPAAVGEGIYVARLDRNASCTWAHDFGGTFESGVTAADDDGDVYFVALVSGTVDLGDGPLPQPANSTDRIVVGKINESGEFRWARVFDGENLSGSTRSVISVSPDGTLYVRAGFYGTLVVDGHVVRDESEQGVLLKFTTDGAVAGIHQLESSSVFCAAPDDAVHVVTGKSVTKLRL